MKIAKVFKASALAAFLLAGTAGLASAQDRLVSGEPYPGFFEGVLIPADGPVVKDQVITEGPTRVVEVERRAISSDRPALSDLAGLYPEAFIGFPVDSEGAPTAFAESNAEKGLN